MSGRRSSLSRGAALLGVVLLLIAGCATVPPPRTPIPPEADRLINLLARRRQEFADLRTLAEIAIRREGHVQRLNGVLLLQAPASLRFEALTPWGQPFLLLAVNAETTTLYEVADHRALIGPASARATERWLGFALEPDELVGLLSGLVVPIKDPYSAELMPADGMGPSLRLTGASGIQRIWLDPETGVVGQVELSGTNTSARITYANGGAAAPPSALTLTTLDGPLTVSIRYRDPKFGTGLSADLFTLTLPEHVKIQRFR